MTEVKNGTEVTEDKLRPGETKYYCRCLRSELFPMCDGTHQSGKLRPLAVTAQVDDTKN